MKAKKKPKRVHKKYDYVAVDTEFTEKYELLELAIVKLDGSTLYHRYFKPKAETWKIDVHGITPEQVADSPNARDCKKEILRVLKSSEVLLFFDPHMDKIVLARAGVHLSDRDVIDVQQMYKPIYDKTPSLSEISKEFKLFQGKEHNALCDARAIAHLFNIYCGVSDMLFELEYNPLFWY